MPALLKAEEAFERAPANSRIQSAAIETIEALAYKMETEWVSPETSHSLRHAKTLLETIQERTAAITETKDPSASQNALRMVKESEDQGDVGKALHHAVLAVERAHDGSKLQLAALEACERLTQKIELQICHGEPDSFAKDRFWALIDAALAPEANPAAKLDAFKAILPHAQQGRIDRASLA